MKLLEVATTVSAAVSQGLALMDARDSRGAGRFVLYDAKRAVSVLSTMSGETTKDMAVALLRADTVVGSMTLEKSNAKFCSGLLHVIASAAKKGFGPLVYDVALAGGKVTPDRLSVSDAAERVWKYYAEKRSDVESGEVVGCKSHRRKQQWLDRWYTLKGSLDLSGLKRAHEGVEIELAGNLNSAEITAALSEAGARHFIEAYREVA